MQPFAKGMNVFSEDVHVFWEGMHVFWEGTHASSEEMNVFREGAHVFREAMHAFRKGMNAFGEGLHAFAPRQAAVDSAGKLSGIGIGAERRADQDARFRARDRAGGMAAIADRRKEFTASADWKTLATVRRRADDARPLPSASRPQTRGSGRSAPKTLCPKGRSLPG